MADAGRRHAARQVPDGMRAHCAAPMGLIGLGLGLGLGLGQV